MADIKFTREEISEIEKNLGFMEAFDKYNQLNDTPKKYIEVGKEIVREVFK